MGTINKTEPEEFAPESAGDVNVTVNVEPKAEEPSEAPAEEKPVEKHTAAGPETA